MRYINLLFLIIVLFTFTLEQKKERRPRNKTDNKEMYKCSKRFIECQKRCRNGHVKPPVTPVTVDTKKRVDPLKCKERCKKKLERCRLNVTKPVNPPPVEPVVG